MTRNDIANSLKPIEWAYEDEKRTYKTFPGASKHGIYMCISPLIGTPSLFLLYTSFDRPASPDGEKFFKSVDEAMAKAREALVDYMCSLFELNEQ